MQCRRSRPIQTASRALFTELEFTSMLKGVAPAGGMRQGRRFCLSLPKKKRPDSSVLAHEAGFSFALETALLTSSDEEESLPKRRRAKSRPRH